MLGQVNTRIWVSWVWSYATLHLNAGLDAEYRFYYDNPLINRSSLKLGRIYETVLNSVQSSI